MAMTATVRSSDRASLERLVGELEAAWNSADGAAFAEAFADDADFVNVYGMHVRGRTAIAAGHRFIFTTIYKDSKVEYRVVSVRELAPGVALVHVSATLNVPVGPMAGRHEAIWTGVATRLDGGWKFAAFQNTHVKEPPIPVPTDVQQQLGR
jgi:uncharacterized protein (TIGR02246 family)